MPVTFLIMLTSHAKFATNTQILTLKYERAMHEQQNMLITLVAICMQEIFDCAAGYNNVYIKVFGRGGIDNKLTISHDTQ